MKSQSGGLRGGLWSRRKKPAVATATGGSRRGISAADTNRNIERLILRDASAGSPQRLYGDHMNLSSGKAVRAPWRGRRPHVRGMVMDPLDHPMGGGQGKSKGGGGRHHPVSPCGQLATGFKTRSKRKPSDRCILERRRGKKKV